MIGTSAYGTKLLIEFKFGSATNESFDQRLPSDGVRFSTWSLCRISKLATFFVAYVS